MLGDVGDRVTDQGGGDRSQRRCPHCGSEHLETPLAAVWHLPLNHTGFTYRRCCNCAFMFSDPLPSPGEVKYIYENLYGYSGFAKRRVFKRLQAEERWRLVRRSVGSVIRKGRLLEIGAGHGHFLDVARRAGWEVTGVEVSREAVRDAKAWYQGVEVHCGTVEEADLAPASFDLVALWHTLEHLLDPVGVLRRASRLLKRGGMLIVGVPNPISLGQRMRGKKWVWCQAPYIHIWHFPAPVLMEILTGLRLTTVEVRTEDTYDAQLLFDVLGVPLQKGLRGASLLGQLLKIKPEALDSTITVAEEVLRLVLYAAEKYPLRLLFNGISRKGLGSELVVFARTVDS
jgi:2-polyprenyl-3-methyl-5-hydroxy-6-metoxy-1,4-benzoquinol methylase